MSNPTPTAPGPYGNPELNDLYELLFCDRPDLFRKLHRGLLAAPWSALLAEAPDPAALRALAEDPEAESRVRLLAFRRLQALGAGSPPRVLLGTVVEVGLPGGLDVLAAYADHRIRYFNQAGKLVGVESPDRELAPRVQALLEASLAVVNRIGPWDQARMAPPKAGTLRMSFLASDGLYLGQGPMGALEQDPMGGPVVGAAVGLLQALMARVDG